MKKEIASKIVERSEALSIFDVKPDEVGLEAWLRAWIKRLEEIMNFFDMVYEEINAIEMEMQALKQKKDMRGGIESFYDFDIDYYNSFGIDERFITLFQKYVAYNLKLLTIFRSILPQLKEAFELLLEREIRRKEMEKKAEESKAEPEKPPMMAEGVENAQAVREL